MYRVVIPLIVVVVALLAVGLGGYLVATTIEGRRRRQAIRDRIEEDMMIRQATWSMEDIAKHRDRLNKNLDDLHDEQNGR